MGDIAALEKHNKELQREVTMLREAVALHQRQLEQANSIIKAQETELVNLRSSLLASRRSISSDVKGTVSPRASSPETIEDNDRKEKRRSKSVHLMEPVHFAEPSPKMRSKTNPTNSSSNFLNLESSLAAARESGALRDSSDSLQSPSKSKSSRRQSIKLFSLGSFGKFRKSMSDLMFEQDPNVDTTTIAGHEKSMNAANLYALLKVRPSYSNLMDRKIIFNFFDDITVTPDQADPKKGKPSALNMITPKLSGLRVECSVGRTKNETHWRSKIEIERMEKLENYYAIYFLGKKHSNFIGFVKAETPVIVSVLDEPEATAKTSTKLGERFFRAILWTPQREYKLFLETPQNTKQNKEGQLKKRDVIKLVFPLVRLTDVKLKRLRGTELYSDLTAFEQHSKVANIKAGVLYVKENQTEEDDMFGNVGGSADLEEFLELLGDNVTLKGFSGFRGGLDVNNNTTGEKSVYTSWSGLEFMFHVSTLLPYFPLDTQHIERKRHLGNDIVNIVFKEGDTPFNPSIIRSTFTQVFIVVEKIKPTEEGGPTHYRMAVASKNGIPPFGPVLRSGFSSLDKAKFRDVLLTKLCNAEMAALDSPVFEQKMTRTRLTLLTTVVKKYLKVEDSAPSTPSKKGSTGLKKSPSNNSLNKI